MLDLGTLGGPSSSASAVSDNGHVVGESETPAGARHAFAWTQPEGMVDLGTLGGADSYASAVDASGQVVGASTTELGAWHAFSWTRAGGMVDLGTLGGPSSRAVAVNGGGQVVGSSATAAGQTHATLWNPVPRIAVSAHGRFGTDGDGQVAFTASNDSVTLKRLRGVRFTFSGQVASVTGAASTAVLTGAGSWNGAGGHTFEISVVDNAPWGRLEDTIDAVIRDSEGVVVFTSFGPHLLKQGDVEVVPAR
jgi:probable HAF family extracellular repeat protein